MRCVAIAVAAVLCLVLATPAPTEEGGPSGNFSGLVDVGGRQLYLECRGAGSPTVILISGYRNDADIWGVESAPGTTMVLPGVAAFTRVCAYGRPGTILDKDHLSRSDAVPMPRTADAIVAELHELLAAAHVAGPYVLVAHSLGGLFARLYASTYPDEVAGMVLVDAWQEDLPALLGPDQWKAYVEIATPPPPGFEAYRALEMVDFAAASVRMSEASAARPLRNIPLIVISRAKPVALPPNPPAAFSADAFEKAWRAGQDRLAVLLPGTPHVIAEKSDHYIQVEQPDLVIDAVRRVVTAVRDPASWPAK